MMGGGGGIIEKKKKGVSLQGGKLKKRKPLNKMRTRNTKRKHKRKRGRGLAPGGYESQRGRGRAPKNARNNERKKGWVPRQDRHERKSMRKNLSKEKGQKQKPRGRRGTR